MTDVARTIEVLDALVGFDTTSRHTNLPLIDWVEDYLKRLGVASERVPYQDDGKTNLWATIGPSDVPGYILSGHTDVVPVDGQSWASDPFRLAERGGKLYARGAADMKGYLACCLAAVPAMQAARLKQPIHLAFSYDEEVGCIGVIGLVERLEKAKVRPRGLLRRRADRDGRRSSATRASARCESRCVASRCIPRSRPGASMRWNTRPG